MVDSDVNYSTLPVAIVVSHGRSNTQVAICEESTCTFEAQRKCTRCQKMICLRHGTITNQNRYLCSACNDKRNSCSIIMGILMSFLIFVFVVFHFCHKSSGDSNDDYPTPTPAPTPTDLSFMCRSCVYGTCDISTGVCACYDGMWGVNCDQFNCDGGCSLHGICDSTRGFCQCFPGWDGLHCSMRMYK